MEWRCLLEFVDTGPEPPAVPSLHLPLRQTGSTWNGCTGPWPHVGDAYGLLEKIRPGAPKPNHYHTMSGDQ